MVTGLENQEWAMPSMNKEDILVAVYMITYNHELYIEQAIKSVVDQTTNFRFKLFIGDDKSTDGTSDIIKALKEKYPEVIDYTLNEINQGPKNNAINILEKCFASGSKYIALLEGDDYWTDILKLQKQIDILEQNPNFSGSFHPTKLSDELDSNSVVKNNRIVGDTASDIINAEDTFSQWSLFHTSSFVFKSNALLIPEWYQKVDSADMALFSIVASVGPLKKIEGIMSVYRKHPNGITETETHKDGFYRKRIELINYLNQFHDYRYSKKANEIIGLYQQSIHFKETAIKEKSMFENFKMVIKNQLKSIFQRRFF